MQYSKNLEFVVNQMLQVSPFQRPTCEKILQIEPVKRWTEKLFPWIKEISDDNNVLLKTIRPTENLFLVTDQLPKPNYENNSENKNRSSNFSAFKLPQIKTINHPIKINSITKISREYIQNIEEENEYSDLISPKELKKVKKESYIKKILHNKINDDAKILNPTINSQKYIPRAYPNSKCPTHILYNIEDDNNNKKKMKGNIKRKIDGLIENSKSSENLTNPSKDIVASLANNLTNDMQNISNNNSKKSQKRIGYSINMNNLALNNIGSLLEVYGNQIKQESLINHQKKLFNLESLKE